MKRTNFGTFCLVALLFAVAGCGSVDWFPKYVRAATTPDAFTFTTQSGVPVSTAITSNSITVSGLTGTGTVSPISVSTGGSYSIGGGTATPTAGTVKNGDTVTVTQTSATAPGTPSTVTLTIGNVTGTFTVVTQTILTPAFVPGPNPSPVSGLTEIFAPITATDVGGHTVSISGAGAEIEIADASNVPSIAFTASTAAFSVPVLNLQHIILLVPVSTVSPTTTLTVDSTIYKISNTSPFTVTASPK